MPTAPFGGRKWEDKTARSSAANAGRRDAHPAFHCIVPVKRPDFRPQPQARRRGGGEAEVSSHAFERSNSPTLAVTRREAPAVIPLFAAFSRKNQRTLIFFVRRFWR